MGKGKAGSGGGQWGQRPQQPPSSPSEEPLVLTPTKIQRKYSEVYFPHFNGTDPVR